MEFLNKMQRLTKKKINNLKEKWSDPNRHFIEKETTMLNNHMQRCSNSSGIKEI